MPSSQWQCPSSQASLEVLHQNRQLLEAGRSYPPATADRAALSLTKSSRPSLRLGPLKPPSILCEHSTRSSQSNLPLVRGVQQRQLYTVLTLLPTAVIIH
jgi:hypothetical protein